MAKKAKKAPARKKDTKGATKTARTKAKVAGKAARAAAAAAKQAKSRQAKARASATAGKVTHKSKAQGLHFSAAQWRAYDAAYNAAEKSGHAQLNARIKGQYASEALMMRRAAIASAQRSTASVMGLAATSFRMSRLHAAQTMQKKAAAAQKQASTAAIALYAVRQSLRQSHLAAQNIALQQRIYADFERHVQTLAHKQFAASGEAKYAHEAVMRTITQSQALAHEQAVFARAVKTAKKASRVTTTGTSARKAQWQQFAAMIRGEVKQADAVINANAKAAGIKAARAVPAPRKARRPAQVPAGTYGPWFGNPDGEDCTAAAVANSVLLQLGARSLTAADYERICELVPEGASVAAGIDAVMTAWPQIGGYDGTWSPRHLRPGMIVCFPTEEGGHAALLLDGGLIASWGEVLPLADVATGEIEEAYEPHWRLRGR